MLYEERVAILRTKAFTTVLRVASLPLQLVYTREAILTNIQIPSSLWNLVGILESRVAERDSAREILVCNNRAKRPTRSMGRRREDGGTRYRVNYISQDKQCVEAEFLASGYKFPTETDGQRSRVYLDRRYAFQVFFFPSVPD